MALDLTIKQVTPNEVGSEADGCVVPEADGCVACACSIFTGVRQKTKED